MQNIENDHYELKSDDCFKLVVNKSILLDYTTRSILKTLQVFVLSFDLSTPPLHLGWMALYTYYDTPSGGCLSCRFGSGFVTPLFFCAYVSSYT
jgi:hypothetical protein